MQRIHNNNNNCNNNIDKYWNKCQICTKRLQLSVAGMKMGDKPTLGMWQMIDVNCQLHRNIPRRNESGNSGCLQYSHIEIDTDRVSLLTRKNNHTIIDQEKPSKFGIQDAMCNARERWVQKKAVNNQIS